MCSPTFRRQLRALNKKNYIIFKRNKKAVLWELLIPIALVAILSLIAVQLPGVEKVPGNNLLINDGFYIEPVNQADTGNLRTFVLDGNFARTNMSVPLIGDSEDPEFISLYNTIAARGLNQSDLGRFQNLGEIRDFIRKSDTIDKAYIDRGFYYNSNRESKTLELNLMSRNFLRGFSPFNKNDEGVSFSIFEYFSFDSYLGNHGQIALENHFNYDLKLGKPIKISAAYTQRSSYAHEISDFPLVMEQIFPIFILIIFTLPYMYILQKAVEEKQTKSRESMRMMGMIDSAYWTSWFIVYLMQVLATSVILTIGSIFTVFKGSNPLLVFCIYIMYGLSIFGICLIMIAIFSSVRTVAVGGIVLKFACYYLRYAFTNSTPTIWRLVSAIFPPLNLYHMAYPVFRTQAFNSVSFSTATDTFRNYNLAYFYFMALVGFFFWTLLGLYVTYIVPTEFGTRKHPCFCLIWKRRRARNHELNDRAPLIQADSNLEESEMSRAANFERVGNDLKELEETNQ